MHGRRNAGTTSAVLNDVRIVEEEKEGRVRVRMRIG